MKFQTSIFYNNVVLPMVQSVCLFFFWDQAQSERSHLILWLCPVCAHIVKGLKFQIETILIWRGVGSYYLLSANPEGCCVPKPCSLTSIKFCGTCYSGVSRNTARAYQGYQFISSLRSGPWVTLQNRSSPGHGVAPAAVVAAVPAFIW